MSLASHDLSLFALCIQGNYNYCALKTHSRLQSKLHIKVSVSPAPCGPKDTVQMNFSLSSIKLNPPLWPKSKLTLTSVSKVSLLASKAQCGWKKMYTCALSVQYKYIQVAAGVMTTRDSVYSALRVAFNSAVCLRSCCFPIQYDYFLTGPHVHLCRIFPALSSYHSWIWQ